MILQNKRKLVVAASALVVATTEGFVTPSVNQQQLMTSTSLEMGLFDGWKAGGTNRDNLDEEWEKQQELLKLRRAPTGEREKYFNQVSLTFINLAPLVISCIEKIYK